MNMKMISVYLPETLIKRMDKAAKGSDEFADRSALIRSACVAKCKTIEKENNNK